MGVLKRGKRGKSRSHALRGNLRTVRSAAANVTPVHRPHAAGDEKTFKISGVNDPGRRCSEERVTGGTEPIKTLKVFRISNPHP
jgi:hypothetical protein